MDAILNPLVQKTKSYIRDTKDFITKVENLQLGNQQITLATMDVTALYTNISSHLGLRCIAKVLQKTGNLPLPPNKILDILKIILHCNNFVFNGEHYLRLDYKA